MRGSNQSGLRAHNERAVLSLIRRHGALAKADIARRTGLSAQTASVIMRMLESEELVLRTKPRRGRVGQPSIPMRLNPDGAFSLGLKIGRRSAELVLMDFVGTLRARERRSYRYPRLAEILDFAAGAARQVAAAAGPDGQKRIAGLGVAMPYDIWSWAEEIGAPADAMAEWRSVDIVAELEACTGRSVNLANDATAACAAEHVFGQTGSADFLYFFVGAFVGGGIVMDGDLVPGRTDNAGALGSIPVPHPDGGGFDQLIAFASIRLLETILAEAGQDGAALWERPDVWGELGEVLDRWIAIAAHGLAHAILAASAVYDFECAVIDGGFPPEVRARLVAETAQRLDGLNRRGLSPITVREGTIGSSAREIGSASLPFFARFLIDHRVLYADRG
nr:ROK family transcriptional regulator [Mangrovicella endophytica]